MKKILFLIPLFFTTQKSFATVYVIASTGADVNNCLSAAPCKTFTQVKALGLTGGDTVYWIPSSTGIYTSSGSGAASPQLEQNDLATHASSWITLKGAGDPTNGGWGNIDFPTGAVIFSGYTSAIKIDHQHYIDVQNFYVLDDNSYGLYLADSDHIKARRIGLKNACPSDAQYDGAIQMSGSGNAPNLGVNDSLLEDIFVVGVSRYSIIVGASPGLSEHNVLRRVVVRWDGSETNQPTAGFAVYGETFGIDGAQNIWLQNCITMDFNNSSFAQGIGDVYAGYYNPHSVKNVNILDSWAFNLGTGWNGWIPGEDTASQSAMYNSVIWNTHQIGILINYDISSVTARGNTVGRTYDTSNGQGYTTFDNPPNVRFENNLFFRNHAVNSDTTVDNFNGYFPSTSNTSGSTNELTSDPVLTIVSSVNPTTAYYGGGLNGANVGATIIYQRGRNGTLWSQQGWNDIDTSLPMFPWPYESNLKSLMKKADSGEAKIGNPSNVTTRGWAGSNTSLADYTVNGGKFGFSVAAQEAAPADSETALAAVFSGVSTGAATVTWTDSSADHNVAFASNSDFSTVIASGVVTSNTTNYTTLSASTQYWFEVKVATEINYNASITTTTQALAPTSESGRARIKGNILMPRGVRNIK